MSNESFRRGWAVLAAAPFLVSAGCGGGGGGDGTPETYDFPSRFDATQSSVEYGGQVVRHLLIADLKTRIGQLNTAANAAAWNDAAPAPTGESSLYDGTLNPFFRSGAGAVPSLDGAAILLTTTPPRLQTTYGQISTGRQLADKIAGGDAAATYYVSWDTSFVGFAAATSFDGPHGTAPVLGWNPTALVDAWLGAISAYAYETHTGVVRQVSSQGAMIDLPIYVDDAGRDYQQLLEKFLVGAVAFSQGTDDYLDADARPTGGLLAPNTQDGTKPYTVLEHAWDEAFAYFGASRDYGLLTDAQIAMRSSDANGDGNIDLTSEHSFAWSVNAATRDTGSCVPTDFTQDIMQAFLRGRAIIADAGDTLTADERVALQAERDIIVSTWEKVIAASAIHYINELLTVDYATTTNLSFLDVAKHWSELKGFALALQFNPRSPFAHTASAPNADFVMLHSLLGDAPVLESEGAAAIDGYKAKLIAARTLLADAYDFPTQNVTGNGGTCPGW